MNNSHDILKVVGQPMMMIGGLVYYVTGNQIAKAIGFAGAVLTTAWVACDMYDYFVEQNK